MSDIFYASKLEVLNKISNFENLIFVGGTSEYIQGIKNELRDIDVCVTNINHLKKIGHIFYVYDYFFGPSKDRAIIKLKDVLIDIFINKELPEYIVCDNKKCQTIQSMIKIRENELKLFIGNDYYKNKLKINLERLKNIPTN